MKTQYLLLSALLLLTGSTVHAQSENEPTVVEKKQLEGDVNGDGVVDSKDLKALDKIYRKSQESVISGMSRKLETKGYKGFFDLGTGLGLDKYDDQIGVDAVVVNGYQFNSYLFAGAGIGYMFFKGTATGSTDFNGGFPVFADVRLTPLKTTVTPLLELRMGGIFGDYSGLYLQPSVGIRIGFAGNMGLTLKLSYQNLHYPNGEEFKHNYDAWGTYTATATYEGYTATASAPIYQNWTVYEDRGKDWGSVWFQIGMDW